MAALVNEAYLRLIQTQGMNWQNSAHFLAMAARLMRRILVDFARSKQYVKRGGGAVNISLAPDFPLSARPERDLVALDDALDALRSSRSSQAFAIFQSRMTVSGDTCSRGSFLYAQASEEPHLYHGALSFVDVRQRLDRAFQRSMEDPLGRGPALCHGGAVFYVEAVQRPADPGPRRQSAGISRASSCLLVRRCAKSASDVRLRACSASARQPSPLG